MIAGHHIDRGSPLQLFDVQAGGLKLSVTGSQREVARDHDQPRLEIRNQRLQYFHLWEVAHFAEVGIGEVNQGKTHFAISRTALRTTMFDKVNQMATDIPLTSLAVGSGDALKK
jgi:hypothetical protein